MPDQDVPSRSAYSVHVTRQGVEMMIDGGGIDRAELLDALRACREGRCGCPDGEFRKVGTFSVEGRGPRIVVALSPKSGAHFDPKRFMACAERFLERLAPTGAIVERGGGDGHGK